ncbi:hypothetical protein QBC46DRAFT_270289 [Diplogelasinospora grovesii]|uniref:Lytic polysaccharide monooxygenase n=1 Tax=Diplogelasinospora grovesii TaxID=303347 RepID=A0AAN6N005_9PEZI|nr:hypothetical protein QBC46DRAFT_270289 [Diplogelasinospora grovesii]
MLLTNLASLPLLFWSGVHGHMIMNMPTPYNHLKTQPFVQVNPLDGDTYPFPCQNRYGIEHITTIEAGGAQLVNFTGGAQHGGGSCQFSISYDDPQAAGGWNASAKFKVIYSIIGGCMAQFTDETKNLPSAARDPQQREDSAHCGNDAGMDCVRQFLIPFPPFLKNGDATFAWTWHNKIGNREMYMTCAPVIITGGTGNQSLIDGLPDVFIANIPAGQKIPGYTPCSTGGSSDHMVLNYPDPGNYGRVLEAPSEPKVTPSDYCTNIPPASKVPKFEEDSRTIQGVSSTAAMTTLSTTTPSAAATPPAGDSSASSSSSSSSSSSTVEMTTSITVTTTVQSSVTSSGSASAAGDSTSSGSSSSGGGGAATPSDTNPVPTQAGTTPKSVPCSTNGALICIDAATFGLCNWGYAIPQQVAPGTRCVDGQILGARDLGFAERRRHLHAFTRGGIGHQV